MPNRYPYGRQPPRPRMNGHFKIPMVPSHRPTLSAGGTSKASSASTPTSSRSVTRPRPGNGWLKVSGRSSASIDCAQRPNNSAAKTVVQSVPAVGNSTKNLMDMDNTLLNAVDLEVIEKQSSPSVVELPPGGHQRRLDEVSKDVTCSHLGNRTVTIPKMKRPFPSLGESHAAKKRHSGLIVLDMTKPSNDDSAPNFSGINQTRTITNQQNTSTIVVQNKQPEILPRSTMIPKEPTVELFDWDSQAFCSQLDRIASYDDNRKTTPEEPASEDCDEIPCYQEINVSIEDEPSSCSQLFMEEVAREPNRPLTQQQNFQMQRDHSTYSQYIRNEYTMLEENRSNVIDDQVDTQRVREFDSSQRRTDVEDDFKICEQNLADMSNINWDESVAGVRPPVAASTKVPLGSIFGKLDGRNGRVTEESPKRVARKSAPLVSSHFQSLGPFYGLPNKIRDLLKEFRGITEMYDWQKECLSLPAIVERTNLIYALPTSGGKTLVAEIIMFREVLLRRRSVMFIVPYVSLAQEKLTALSPFAVAMEFLVEEYSGGKGMIPPRKRRKKQSIFVCTIEKALVLLDSLIEADRANEIGLLCIDELHMIGEPNRGANLEALITKTIAIQAGIQIVGMSATIGNLGEIAKFMSADIFSQNFRPVELKEFVKCGDDLLEIKHGAKTLQEAFLNKKTVNFGYSDVHLRIDPDHVIGLLLETFPQDPCLIFCPTKRQCEQLCSLLVEHLSPEIAEFRASERRALIELLAHDGSTATLLPAAFRLGIAYHHSGLTFDERKLIEDAFRAKVLSLIICTSTLAAGVNLPAKRVIIRSPFIATSFLTLSRYKQMVGRAGRAGFGSECGESILICSKKDISAVCNLLCSPMDEANSSLHVDGFAHLKNLILSAIGLGICSTRNDIQSFVSKTLLAIQADRLEIDLPTVTDVAITNLYKENAIKAKSDACLRNPANMTIQIDTADTSQADTVTQNRRNGLRELEVYRESESSVPGGKLVKSLKKNARLEVNLLGKAAIRSGFHMERAARAYDELKRVGEKLNVTDELHLLYVIVMEDGGEIRPKEDDFILFFNKLTPEDTRIAKRFEINDYTISKILGRRLVQT
ncbi:helicase POLQ-like isoform X2 [Armigeres subalbatus]|uniref:helicase POLQ-like isoform X2 n=1 Tax=Armigeres subalbatus TaxID=124917 RepID=UPI002ED0EA0E